VHQLLPKVPEYSKSDQQSPPYEFHFVCIKPDECWEGWYYISNYRGDMLECAQTAKCGVSLSQKVTYLFCDELDIVSKELRSRVRQATKDVVKSEV